MDLLSEAPKTTLKFKNSLEGITELREAIRLMVMIYDSRRTQMTIRRVEGSYGRV